jgi:hypothetical protein
MLIDAHAAGRLQFFGDYQHLADARAFRVYLGPLWTTPGDPKHLGAKIGITAVVHTWGSAMTHHPHLHMIVTGGGISPDGSQWVASQHRLSRARRGALRPVPGAHAAIISMVSEEALKRRS